MKEMMGWKFKIFEPEKLAYNQKLLLIYVRTTYYTPLPYFSKYYTYIYA